MGRRIRRPVPAPGATVSEGGQVPLLEGPAYGVEEPPSPEGAVPPWRGGLEAPVTRHARRTAAAELRAQGAGAAAEAAPRRPVPPETAQEANRKVTGRRGPRIIPAAPGARDARKKVRETPATAIGATPDTHPGPSPRVGRAPRPFLASARDAEANKPREPLRVRVGAPRDMGRAVATRPPHLR